MGYPNIKAELENEINIINEVNTSARVNFKENVKKLLLSDVNEHSFQLIEFYKLETNKHFNKVSKEFESLKSVNEVIKYKSNNYLLSNFNRMWLNRELFKISKKCQDLSSELDNLTNIALKLKKLQESHRSVLNKISA